jgi:hypothetical protein
MWGQLEITPLADSGDMMKVMKIVLISLMIPVVVMVLCFVLAFILAGYDLFWAWLVRRW